MHLLLLLLNAVYCSVDAATLQAGKTAAFNKTLFDLS